MADLQKQSTTSKESNLIARVKTPIFSESALTIEGMQMIPLSQGTIFSERRPI